MIKQTETNIKKVEPKIIANKPRGGIPKLKKKFRNKITTITSKIVKIKIINNKGKRYLIMNYL